MSIAIYLGEALGSRQYMKYVQYLDLEIDGIPLCIEIDVGNECSLCMLQVSF